jgi:predicted DCC family thiol-disulfide oxidoreductase YuxK
MMPRDKPVMLYDGDCGFCRTWIERWARLTRGTVAYAPFQQVMHEFPEIRREELEAAVQLVEPDGHRTQGAEAAFRSLAHAGRPAWRWMYEHFPPFAIVAEWGYRRVARHRSRLPHGRATG